MDFPYAIEGGSTIKFFWVLNKLYMAKREAILKKLEVLKIFNVLFFHYFLSKINKQKNGLFGTEE